MPSLLLFMCIGVPLIAGVVCFSVRMAFVRTFTVLVTGAVLTAGALMLLGHGTFHYTPPAPWGGLINAAVSLTDFALLGIMFQIARRHRHKLIMVLVALQALPLMFFELFLIDHKAPAAGFYGDNLSLIITLIVSIVGSLICVFALPYMQRHEAHQKLAHSRQPRFFFLLLAFLGAMNGLALSNDIVWLYFFFEVTTLCSFLLIGYDGTELAVQNALRALWMNALGGVAFVGGMIGAHQIAGTTDIQQIVAAGPAAALLVPMALFCLAGFTKSAQVPFQSWLLGAMVAPTPVSALLHSSTMVKAGVYVIFRFAPVFAGTFFSQGLAIVGSFTFLVTIALALGQRNAKKILAYSTISNLGLIIACAGINTPTALAAGILLIIFHAVSKALLFLCVGTIEQEIGSRDIEDMRGLFAIKPRIAVITVIGIMTMLLPPFGVLISKWMAIEAASNNLPAVGMIAMGSALGFVVWGRWAGILMSAPYKKGLTPEPMSAFTIGPLNVLAGGAVLFSLVLPWIYSLLVRPMLAFAPYKVSFGSLDSPIGGFTVIPIFIILALGFVAALKQAQKTRARHVAPMYMSGLHSGGPDDETFRGPMNRIVQIETGNYYLTRLFGEEHLTFWVNNVAIALLVLMMGGAL